MDKNIIMENLEINYFSNEGLTAVSANYISNLCKEYYQNLEYKLNNIRFYSTSLKIIGNPTEEFISYYTSYIEKIPSIVQEIAECKALIAWFREAIKEKDKITKNLNNYTLEQWIIDTNREPLKFPQCEKTMTEEEYLNSLTVKERNRWLTVEALASTIGKVIHQNGSLSNARKDLNNKLQNPIETEINGRDTLIYKYSTIYCHSDIEDIFFELQTKQREAQAELNGMKHKMEIAIEEDGAKKNDIWKEQLAEYKLKEAEYLSKYKEYCDEQRKLIRNLKIVIPNNLKSIYDKINGLGKNK